MKGLLQLADQACLPLGVRGAAEPLDAAACIGLSSQTHTQRIGPCVVCQRHIQRLHRLQLHSVHVASGQCTLKGNFPSAICHSTHAHIAAANGVQSFERTLQRIGRQVCAFHDGGVSAVEPQLKCAGLLHLQTLNLVGAGTCGCLGQADGWG